MHVLRSRPAEILTNPLVLLVANLGGLALLYCTPFYTVTTLSLLLHELVHIHFFITGYLFAWMITGPDPGPHRPTVPIRIVILGVAVLGHSVLAQLLYAGLLIHVPASAEELHDAGTLMYYWGTSPKSFSRWRYCSPGSQSEVISAPCDNDAQSSSDDDQKTIAARATGQQPTSGTRSRQAQ